MKTLTALGMALVLLLIDNAALADRQKVDETKTAAADGFVHILVVRGHLKVEGWDKAQVHVSGLLDERTKAFIFDVDKHQTTIEVRLPRGASHGWWHSAGSDLVVQVPRNSRVDVSVVSTDTEVGDIQGGLRVHTVSGDLTVDHVAQTADLTSVSGDVVLHHAAGRLSANTVSGDITLSDGRGSMKLHSVSGDITCHRVSGDFDVQTISGDISADEANYKQVSGNSVSGDVTFDGRMQPGGSSDFDSVSGTIRLRFKGGVDARFDLDAGSGSIRNNISNDKPVSSKYTHEETLRFIKGSGKGEVTASTRSGDIVISAD